MSLRSSQFGINDIEFNAQINKEIQALGLGVGRVFAGIVEEAFVYLVHETPQWSGTMAASWNMTVNRASNHISEWLDPTIGGGSPRKKGVLPPIADALSRAEGRGKISFKGRFEAHGWTIEINNALWYASDVNSGKIKLRAEVGHSPHFVERFTARVASSQVGFGSNWGFYANTPFLLGA